MTIGFSLSVKWLAALGKSVSVRVRGSLFKCVVKRIKFEGELYSLSASARFLPCVVWS